MTFGPTKHALPLRPLSGEEQRKGWRQVLEHVLPELHFISVPTTSP